MDSATEADLRDNRSTEESKRDGNKPGTTNKESCSLQSPKNTTKNRTVTEKICDKDNTSPSPKRENTKQKNREKSEQKNREKVEQKNRRKAAPRKITENPEQDARSMDVRSCSDEENDDDASIDDKLVDAEKSGEGVKSEVDPLNVDMYEKLCVENDVDQSERIQWDNYIVYHDLQKYFKKIDKQFYTVLMSIFAVMTFAMVFGLFVLQAQMSMNSKELMAQVQSAKKPIPQGMYNLYFDYLEGRHMPDKVDLRANTTIFVH